MKKRVTPEDDFERLAERINTNYGSNIQDAETFNNAYNLYLGDDENALKNNVLRRKTFAYLRKLNPKIKSESIFKDAKGKDFARDKKKRAKKVVKTEKEYKKLGASKVDLEGYDTPTRTRRNVVYTFVVVRGKRQRRARNPKTGRFERLK